VYEAYVVSIRSLVFDILLMFSLKVFGSAGETLQGHAIFLAILHQGIKRAMFMRAKGHDPTVLFDL
jgi:hypothetical protein